jgi:predicted RNA-binding protein YlxR (DUF448 family)
MRNSSPHKTQGPLLDCRPHVPQRTCVGCRTMRAPQEFLRLACTPQGAVILDRSRRLPGRGVYVCCDVVCLRIALKPARLLAAFKQPVTVPTFDVVYQAAVSLLQDRLKACFGLARKAGAAVSGYASLHTALAHAKVGCLVLTKDIAASRAEEYYGWCAQQNIPYVTLFSKEELGRMLGRPSCSAVGFTVPRFCELLYATIASLGRLSSPDSFSEGASGLFPSSF